MHLNKMLTTIKILNHLNQEPKVIMFIYNKNYFKCGETKIAISDTIFETLESFFIENVHYQITKREADAIITSRAKDIRNLKFDLTKNDNRCWFNCTGCLKKFKSNLILNNDSQEKCFELNKHLWAGITK